MSSIIFKGTVGDEADIQFRAIDCSTGLGVELDFDSSLQLKFYDNDGTVIVFTGTTTSTPAVQEDSDAGGFFYFLEDIDTTGWLPGLVRMEADAKIDGDDMPTSIKYVMDLSPGVSGILYCSIQDVKNELPSSIPSTITDTYISVKIDEASREIDDWLFAKPGLLYTIPFQALPDTPGTIRHLTCKLTVYNILMKAIMLDRGKKKQGVSTRRTEVYETLGKLIPKGGMQPQIILADAGVVQPEQMYVGELEEPPR